jgi:glycerophosphoryl diester phosphodiesterase
MPRPEVIAHRGLPRKARENTLPSFALALEAGADGIELDVHATKDGGVVVHHDARLPGGGPGDPPGAIRAMTLAELRRAGSGGEHVPTLAETVDLVGRRAVLYVELKGHGIEDLVAAELRQTPGRTAVHSFDHRAVLRFGAISPATPRGVLLTSYLVHPVLPLRDTGARDYWQHWELIDEALVDAVHAAGGRVIAWTVNTTAEMQRLAAMGVDGLCTDLAGEARGVIDALR